MPTSSLRLVSRCAVTGAVILAVGLAAGGVGCADGPESGTASAAPTTGGTSTAKARVAARRPRPGPVRLGHSDNPHVTFVATLRRPVLARSAPRESAPAWLEIPKETPYTGRRARLMVTGAFRDRTGREWVRVLLAMRPNGTTAWIPKRDLRLSATHYRIKVDLSERRLDLYRDGRRVARHHAGVGRPEYPTPTGLFAVEDLVPSAPSWRPAYGRYVLTLTAFSNVLTSFMGGEGQSAIHGSGNLGKVGKASSFGCVVLSEAALANLFRRVGAGTPVEIVA